MPVDHACSSEHLKVLRYCGLRERNLFTDIPTDTGALFLSEKVAHNLHPGRVREGFGQNGQLVILVGPLA